MRFEKWQVVTQVVTLVTALALGRASAQQCDDFEPCTTNDMCNAEGFCMGTPANSGGCDDDNECTTNDMCDAEGLCMGTPTNSGSCDDGNDCTINDHCTLDRGCTGDSLPLGTTCQSGCGTCQALGGVPIPGFPLICMPDQGASGRSCELTEPESPCTEGACSVFGIPGFQTVLCIGRQKVCPDTDGNPCNDACNPATGQCEVGASTCFPGCETCNPQTGACEAINIGGACTTFGTFGQCEQQGRCTLNPVDGNRALCFPGAPVEATATPTQQAATPTRTTPAPTATAAVPTATRTTPAPTNTAAAPTPTRTTPAPTATTGTPAATSTPGGESTPTAIETTPTPGAGGCQGDCDNDGVVKVNELILQVNIALGKADLERCRAGDGNDNGSIAINELIRATGNALRGCAG